MLYDDVWTVVYCNQTKQSWKALNQTYSVKLWLDQIKDEGSKSMFKDEVVQDKEHYLFAWCMKFQLKVCGPHAHRLLTCECFWPDQHCVCQSFCRSWRITPRLCAWIQHTKQSNHWSWAQKMTKYLCLHTYLLFLSGIKKCKPVYWLHLWSATQNPGRNCSVSQLWRSLSIWAFGSILLFHFQLLIIFLIFKCSSTLVIF